MLGEAPPADTADHHLRPEPPSKKLAFSILRLESLTYPGCELPSPVRSWRVPPGHPTLPFLLYLSDSESWSPVGRRREPPGQTTLPFPPHGRRDLPIQTASIFLPSDVGESLPATQLYLSVFTCPTQRVLISRWTPARCSRPDNLTFFCLYLSNTASLDLLLDAGEVLPARQSYFLCLYLSNTASPGISLDAGEVLPARQSYFSCLYLSNTGVSISLWMPARCSRPDNLTFPVFTCPTRESQSPVGCRRGAPGQTNALPSARTKNIEPRRTRHTRPFWQS